MPLTTLEALLICTIAADWIVGGILLYRAIHRANALAMYSAACAVKYNEVMKQLEAFAPRSSL